MYIKLENINKIQSANVKIGGLTVLAGENDTGKSTVGKALFSIIKALSRQDDDFKKNKEQKISSLCDELYFSHRKVNNRVIFETFRKEFYPPRLIPLLIPYIDSGKHGPVVEIQEKKELVGQLDISVDYKKQLIDKLEDIERELLSEESEEAKYQAAVRIVLNSEFYRKVCSEESQEGSIALIDDSFSATIRVTRDKKFTVNEDASSFHPFIDATFIETPLYLQLKHVFEQTGTLLDADNERKFLPKIPLHIKDLMRKLELIKYADVDDVNIELFKKLETTMQGSFRFNKKTEDILFHRKLANAKEMELSLYNVASGIKVFGIIQLLLSVKEIGARKILILDEPENHLHPKWQLELAHILVILLKENIPIVLTSHSPYFIQAIVHYSKLEEVEDLVSFYLAEVNEQGRTTMDEVTDDLNRIFIKLAAPMQEIL